MNKILLKFLVLFFMLTSIVFSEELDKSYGYREFNSYENPIYYAYMDNYLNILGEAYSKIKFFRIGICIIFDYKLHKDGTISDLEADSLSNSSINEKKLRKLVENNLPPKFSEGMNEEYVNIHICFGTNPYVEEYRMEYFPSHENKKGHYFRINLDRKI